MPIPLALPTAGLPSITGVTLDLQGRAAGADPAGRAVAAPRRRAPGQRGRRRAAAGTATFTGSSTRRRPAASSARTLGSTASSTRSLPLIDSPVDLDPAGPRPGRRSPGHGLRPDRPDRRSAARCSAGAGRDRRRRWPRSRRSRCRPSLADVQIAPNEQIADGSSLIQRALHVSISLVRPADPRRGPRRGEGQRRRGRLPGRRAGRAAGRGRQAGGEAGRRAVGRRPAAGSARDRKLVLVDVLKEGGHVKLLGAANRDYVGKKVAIRLRRGDKVVAHATVRKDGSFETTAPLPPTRGDGVAHAVQHAALPGRDRQGAVAAAQAPAAVDGLQPHVEGRQRSRSRAASCGR